MRKSFYTWLMTPKHTDNFETISRYLEDEADFAFNLSEFDKIWEEYLAH